MSQIKFVKDVLSEQLYQPNTLTIELDGSQLKTESDFLVEIWKKLNFPVHHICWDAYLDWITDLSWIKEKTINIVINNFSDFLSSSPKHKKHFIEDANQHIIPYWDKNAAAVWEEQEEQTKTINIYCVENDSDFQNGWSVINSIHTNILEGRKTAHGVSDPVIYQEENKCYIAVFVYFYNGYQLKKGFVNRPSMWAICDIKTGEIIKRYDISAKDFSDLPPETPCDIRSETEYNDDELEILKEKFEKSIEAFDEVRFEYINTGKINLEKYRQYLTNIIDFAPKSFKQFYLDLSIKI
jgi:hypothetical protein